MRVPAHVSSLQAREQARRWPPPNAILPRERSAPAAFEAQFAGPLRGEILLAHAPANSTFAIACGNGKPQQRTAPAAREAATPEVVGTPPRSVRLLPGLVLDGDHPNLANPASGFGALAGPEVLLPGRGASTFRPPADGALFARAVDFSPGRVDVSSPTTSAKFFHAPVVVQYRNVLVEVDPSFAAEYTSDLRHWRNAIKAASGNWDDLGYGLVSSVGDTIDAVWWRIKQHKGGFDHYHDLIGCWNLHQGEADALGRYRFWIYGWGAPHKVHLWTCQMLYDTAQYMELRDYPGMSIPSYVTACDGLGWYIRDALAGGSPPTHKGEGCFLTFSYRSDGKDANKVHAWCGTQGGDAHLLCDDIWSPEEAVPSCKGTWWDNWTPVWSSSLSCVSVDGQGLCAAPYTGCDNANGRHHDFSIHLHAIQVAFDGLVVDTVMFLARTVYDYSRWLKAAGRANEALDAAESAELMARYGLGVLAERSRLLIHEIGHAYTRDNKGDPAVNDTEYEGSDHCSFNCCNDISQTLWWCWVRSALGLPFYPYAPVSNVPANALGGGDFAADVKLNYQELDNCSHDSEPVLGLCSQAVHVWSCTTRRSGEAGLAPAGYCSTGCVAQLEVPTSDGTDYYYYDLHNKLLKADWREWCAG